MAIKNYTTKIDAYQSIGEIQGALARAGATKIMIDYNSGKPVAVTFAIHTNSFGDLGFSLPAAVEGTLRVFKKQNLKTDIEQAEKTAWRNIRDWILAQLALVESCDIPLDEVFLPYLISSSTGDTLYTLYSKGDLPLMLSDGK